MKATALAVASLLAALAPAAHAAYDRYGNYYEPRDYRSNEYLDNRDDYARVIESRPVYADSREECWNMRERRFEPRPDRGRYRVPYMDFNNCRTVAGRDLEGYDVRYAYNGEEYTTRMSSDPGRRLRVGRDIAPDGSPLGVPPEGRTYYPAGGG